MVRFEFVLSDEDAELLLDMVNKYNDSIVESMCELLTSQINPDKRTPEDESKMQWFKEHRALVNEIKETMVSGSSKEATP